MPRYDMPDADLGVQLTQELTKLLMSTNRMWMQLKGICIESSLRAAQTRMLPAAVPAAGRNDPPGSRKAAQASSQQHTRRKGKVSAVDSRQNTQPPQKLISGLPYSQVQMIDLNSPPPGVAQRYGDGKDLGPRALVRAALPSTIRRRYSSAIQADRPEELLWRRAKEIQYARANLREQKLLADMAAHVNDGREGDRDTLPLQPNGSPRPSTILVAPKALKRGVAESPNFPTGLNAMAPTVARCAAVGPPMGALATRRAANSPVPMSVLMQQQQLAGMHLAANGRMFPQQPAPAQPLSRMGVLQADALRQASAMLYGL